MGEAASGKSEKNTGRGVTDKAFKSLFLKSLTRLPDSSDLESSDTAFEPINEAHPAAS